jgi:hypothetical protein
MLIAATVVAGLVAAPVSGAATGSGTIFAPNPVADLQDQSLTDRKDSDYAALQPAYHDVALTDLDGSGYLRGRWATIRNTTGKDAFSKTNTFRFHRDEAGFEQVMAYHWVTVSQNYIRSLGFGTTRRPINDEPQDVRINQYGIDNSYSWDKHDVLRFGKGGVDDAEDAEVILHEYGHAMHDAQQEPFGFVAETSEAGAIGEGFGAYWAVTVADTFAPTPDAPCVADWDAVSYTAGEPHCLRRVDTDLRYPDDLDGRVHHDGMIWSRALWDLRNAIGARQADTVILEAQFDMGEPTMPFLAARIVEHAGAEYGDAAASAARAVFEDRGILG